MSNRSKKVVMSARVAPYIKAAIDTYANSKNEKFVKVLEIAVENFLHDQYIDNPFDEVIGGKKKGKIPFMSAFIAIWTDDEFLLQLRLGACGPGFSGESVWMRYMLLSTDPEFFGDGDIFKGASTSAIEKLGYLPPKINGIDIEKARKEWPEFCRYVEFLENNKPFQPTYKEWREIASRSSEG